MPTMTHRVRSASLATALGFVLTLPTSARQCDTQILTWVGGNGASMLDPLNWSPPMIPGTDATLVFEQPGPASPTLEAMDLIVNRIVLRGGPVELGLDDATLLAASSGIGCPALAVGGPGPARFLLGITIGDDERYEMASASVGTVDGPGAILGEIISFTRLDVPGALIVGDVADGTVERIGNLTAGSVTVGRDAPGMLDRIPDLSVAGDLIIGDESFGTVTDSSVTANRLVLGAARGGIGEVLIDDQRTADIELGADIGARGFGMLQVSDGIVNIGGNLRLGVFAIGETPGFFDRGDGFVSIAGADSLLAVGGDLAIGLLGHAELEIISPARVTVAGSVTTNGEGEFPFTYVDQRATIRLGEPAGVKPLLSAGGAIDLPELEVRFAAGFNPSIGDSWTLIEAGTALTMSPIAPMTVPLLPPGLDWSILNDDQRLIATIVAAPAPPGDIDGDGIVGLDDLLIVLSSFGPCPAGDPCPADLDGNGAVDFLDLVQVLGGWSEPAP